MHSTISRPSASGAAERAGSQQHGEGSSFRQPSLHEMTVQEVAPAAAKWVLLQQHGPNNAVCVKDAVVVSELSVALDGGPPPDTHADEPIQPQELPVWQLLVPPQ